MKYICLFLFVITTLLYECTDSLNKGKESKNAVREENIPIEIIKLNMKEFYNNAKWCFYLSNFDIKTLYCGYPYYQFKLEVPAISMNLHMAWCRQYNDTIEVEFSFEYEKDSIYCYNSENINNYFVYGTLKGYDTVLFRTNEKAKYPTVDDCYADTILFAKEVEYLKKNGYKSFKEQEKKFVEYISQTTDNINPWLKEEAIKRGILKE